METSLVIIGVFFGIALAVVIFSLVWIRPRRDRASAQPRARRGRREAPRKKAERPAPSDGGAAAGLDAEILEEDALAGDEEPAGSEAAFTAFAPPAAAPSSVALIQVWVHTEAQIERVRALAGMTDASAEARPTIALSEQLPDGARIEVRFEADDLQIDEPVCALVWRGEPVVAHFRAKVPAEFSGEAALARIRVYFNDAPIGSGVVRIAVQEGAEPGGEVEIGVRRYRTAFLSYARADLDRVLEHHQSLKAVGLEVFQDILSLEPGERWERELYRNIENCDVFLLYWSGASATSEFVLKEAEWARQTREASPDRRPDIIPIVLESPPPPPPQSLADLHFDDPLRRLMLAGG